MKIIQPFITRKTLQKLPFLKMISFAALIIISSANYAQETQENRGEITSNGSDKKKEKPESEIKTIFGGNIEHGGYGGASILYSEFNGEGALLVGGRGGWIINHYLSIGVAGYGITNNLTYENILTENNNVENKKVQLDGGYGGMMFEFIAFPKSPVHINFPILVGAGGVSYTIKREITNPRDLPDPDDEEFEFLNVDDDAVFVIEPGVEIELNVLRNFRIAMGASYRYFGDMDLINTKSDAFDGIAGGITFKFGKF